MIQTFHGNGHFDPFWMKGAKNLQPYPGMMRRLHQWWLVPELHGMGLQQLRKTQHNNDTASKDESQRKKTIQVHISHPTQLVIFPPGAYVDVTLQHSNPPPRDTTLPLSTTRSQEEKKVSHPR